MFDFKLLEVAIGLIFVYLLLSLLATAINEFVMRFFYSRGKNLKYAIQRMLEDQNPPPGETNDKNEKKNSLTEDLYNHPLIKKLYRPSRVKSKLMKGMKLPSFISSTLFTKTLLAVLSDSNSTDITLDKIKTKIEEIFKNSKSETRQLLEYFISEAGDNVEKFQNNIETWFNNTMDRAGGWYKHRLQQALVIIGLFISAFVNADSIKIIETLSHDPQARADMVSLAEGFLRDKEGEEGIFPDSIKTMPDSLLQKEILNLIQEDISQAGSVLGLGWQFPREIDSFGGKVCYIACEIPYRFIGWLLTAFAISLGAPFWFDTLKRVMSIRQSGTKPPDNTAGSPAVG